MSKIAFLFLTIDNINHPDLWKEYLFNDLSKISIYVHPKYPQKVSVDWMKENIISTLVHTSWGYLTDAFYHLLKEAYQDSKNEHFIFVSDSCIPLCKFSHFYKFIQRFSKRTSFIHFKDTISDYDWHNKITKVPRYQKYKLKKHEGLGNCLSRYHVQKLLDSKLDFNIFFNNLNCGDEYYLSLLDRDKYIYDQEMTYYNWEENNHQIKSINILMDQIYQHAENKEIERVNKRIASLKKKNYQLYKLKLKSLQQTLKKISNGNNKRLLSKSQREEIQKLRIQKSNLGKHPKTYIQVSKSLVRKLRSQGYFFLRKVDSRVKINLDK